MKPLPCLHPYWSIHWPMMYGNDEFVAKGTVLDITGKSWLAEGPMPVSPGMRLNIWLWHDIPERLRVGEATVNWVNGYAFGLDMKKMDPIGHARMTQFLDQAMNYWFASRAA